MTTVEMASDSQVLVEEKPNVRILTLNRPKQLNALCPEIVSRLLQLFLAYEEDPTVKLVILKGKGEPFVLVVMFHVLLVTLDMENGVYVLINFMGDQYKLNYVMATYSKSQVSILDGIVMGGRAGLSIHGRFRIATDNTVFAMPETAVGLFPDVGASYFLSRLPGFLGEYIGLTGARLDGADMLACGLATHFVPSKRLNELEADLCRVSSSDPDSVSKIIDAYTQQPNLKKKSVYHRLDIIDRCFSRRTVEDIISTLEKESTTQEPDVWISSTIRSLKKASPASLKICLRSIREGRCQGVGQCLIREYRIVCHVMKAEISNDCIEGCRALLLEKDGKPKWKPYRLEEMKDNMVDQYFKKVEGWEDLKFPQRKNLSALMISKL